MSLYEIFKARGQLLILSKGDTVFRQGEVDRNLYFVETGLLRATYLRENGKEMIKSFLRENDLIGSLSSCVEGDSSTFSLVGIENSKLLRLPFLDLAKSADIDLEVATQIMQLLLNLAMKKERREFEFLCLDAEKRYELLRSRDAALLERLTQNDVAKYLGITPVALSRIRRRLVG